MKRIFFISILLFTISGLKAENYKVLSNNPPKTPILSLNTDLFHFELVGKSLAASTSNVGIWGHYEFKHEKLGAQFLLRKSFLAFGRLEEKNFPGNTEIELGTYYTLFNSVRSMKTKVMLKREYTGTTYSTNVSGDQTYQRNYTDTYLIIPSDKKIMGMVRGGLYSKKYGISLNDLIEDFRFSNGYEYAKIQSMGIYAGVSLRVLTSIFIDTESYGIQYASIGNDLYFDVLILPVNNFKKLDGTDINDAVKNNLGNNPIGFKAGYKLYQVDKRIKTGKMYGLCATAEAGVRPYSGWFVGAGIGLTFIK